MGEVAEFRKVDGRQKVVMKQNDLSTAHLAAVADGLRRSFSAQNSGQELKNFRMVNLPADMVEKYQREFIREAQKLQATNPGLPFYAGSGLPSAVEFARKQHPDLFELSLAEKVDAPWQSDVEMSY